MTDAHLTINPAAAAGNGFATVILGVHRSAGNAPYRGAFPAVVSRGQAYFWTHRWQEFERESADALAAGDFAEFDHPDDAIRWLLSDEG